MVDYRTEMRKLKKNRKRYRPALARLMAMRENHPKDAFPVRIDDVGEMLLVLELVDVGYVDPESLIVRKRFGDISSVHYTGAFPLTENGFRFYQGDGIGGRLRLLLEYFIRK
ncbi:MAG TPA: hypothetical protein PK307_11830 [Spirochaetota bacterium]|nr:hypothetical protein [Spirochaetota bacterium]HOD14915.1 hypothetical protein [Spirochaetota bacterium]HPG50699.1 hypothetical protein [Spirochaetota bacterium]HPN12366.1 hypothetical protein [Spirochaetota bacterium]HQL82888.1 hypothetical protein [Spirochaetota bacterium]